LLEIARMSDELTTCDTIGAVEAGRPVSRTDQQVVDGVDAIFDECGAAAC